MRFPGYFMRQALLAACLTFPMPSLADPGARFDAASNTVRLTGLEASQRAEILLHAEALRLMVASLGSARGMPVTLNEQDADIVITPRFALRAGTDYVLSLDLADRSYDLDLALPVAEVSTPELIVFSPSQVVIPANTLRLYVQFSEPMARGQLRDVVTLMASDGTQVQSPFLNLEAELWDPSQSRATLLLDPGRIKQGVGPNTQAGAPLQPGKSYRLVVSARMESAAGIALGADVTIGFRVGPAERRALSPEGWQILPPAAGSHAPLTVAFDRIMDSGAVRRLLRLQDSAGRALRGQITTDGGGWSFVPERAWQAGGYQLIVDPELEDVSGNTIGAPFDAAPGTIGTDQESIILTIDIA
jgi:hypothetical protein